MGEDIGQGGTGVFICVFLGQRAVSPAHPSPASLCHSVLIPRSLVASPGHSILSIFPFLNGDSRSITREGRRCRSTVLLMKQGINPATPVSWVSNSQESA